MSPVGPSWFRGLRRVEAAIVTGEKAVCALAMAVMMFSTGLTVLARNAAIQMPNYGELGLAALVPLTLIGGALCTAVGSHIAIDIVQNLSSRIVTGISEVAIAVATVVFAYIYASSGIYLLIEFRETGDKLLDLGTPLWILALFFPIGMVLMAFHALMRVLALFLAGDEGEAGGAAT
ncbi:MAG TPA: TRAP transporter small permease [Aquamicrobium sp.]|nr:TRAP transporter small permease [Aquamicrobium sp.]